MSSVPDMQHKSMDRVSLNMFHELVQDTKDPDSTSYWYFLQNESDINGKDSEGATPLHCAALVENLEVSKALVSSGVYINATTKSGRTVIHFAISSLSHQVLAFLLENNATIPYDIEYTLQKPSGDRQEDAEHRKICEAILNRKKKMDNTGNHYQNRRTTMTPFWSPLVGSLLGIYILRKNSSTNHCFKGDNIPESWEKVSFSREKPITFSSYYDNGYFHIPLKGI